MRQETPFGPVWIFPDALPEKAAKHGARLELMWPDLEGFSAMHAGPPPPCGAWVVRAPMVALERAGLQTGSASEHPVAEGTVWPPIDQVKPEPPMRRWIVEYTPGPPAIGTLTTEAIEAKTSEEVWQIIKDRHRWVMIHKVREPRDGE